MNRCRYVFVAGLHRSGTSLIARCIGAHPMIGAIRGSGAPEDEGVYLQGAIPHTARDGRPGVFAFDPGTHLTEASRFNSLEVKQRIEHEWGAWFGPERWRLEKSPLNLLRTRLYQQLFPMAHFVIVVRHPIAVSRATSKWSDAHEDDLMRHWEVAHATLLQDLPFLHCAMVVRYEEFCADPSRWMRTILAFLDLEDSSRGISYDDISCQNARYLDGSDAGPLPEAARTFGYGTHGTLSDIPAQLRVRHPLRAVRERVLAGLRD